MDSGYYAACAGLRAKSQALEVVANNVANLNSTGYASAQVDKKKIGQLAVAIQTAFQQMGVFPGTGTGTAIPSTSDQALTHPDNQQALVNRIVYQEKLLPSQEEEDISQLIPELQKSLGPELLRNEVALRTEIDGLVISLREIGFYKQGLYGEYSTRNLTQYYRQKYFDTFNNQLRVGPKLKTGITFSRLNLLDDARMAFMKSMDVIFCCNVLIYFDVLSKRHVIQHFYNNLLPHGYFFLGIQNLFSVSETTFV